MAFNLSPSVNIIEKDLSTFVSGVASSIGAVVGDFEWGPANKRTLISNEENLVSVFGEPNDVNYSTWFTASNFLAYAKNLKVVRALDSAARNATDGTALLVDNVDNIDYSAFTDQTWVAKYAGAFGNNVGVSVCQRNDFSTWKYKSYFDQFPQGDDILVVVTLTENLVTDVKEAFELSLSATSKDGYGVNNYIETALERNSNYIYCKGATIVASSRTATSGVGQADIVTTANSKVITSALAISGEDDWDDSGTNSVPVLAGEQIVLTGLNTGTYDIESVDSSGQITLVQRLEFSDTAVTVTFQGALTVSGLDSAATLTGGIVVATSTAEQITGWAQFLNADESDVSLLMEGGVSGGDAVKLVANYIVDSVAEVRKDCIAFVSPEQTGVTGATPVTAMITDRNLLSSSSYGFMDGNYKFQYDKFNDVFRWIPLNGDIAGLAALTEETHDAWWSMAGYNRGNIKNVTKLAFNPTKAQRDDMYVSNINPVISESGEGTILFGDKTLQTKSSAFDRINVRRLFIVLEKSIANAAKYNLFEFNDEFTRARFVQTITPFLRDVQARRGVTDFSVIADETVNTDLVIDANEFRASILIKPNKSINFINLTFTAVASGVSFDEVTV